MGGVWEYGLAPSDEFLKWLMTFFRFVDETYVEVREVAPERHAIKRAKRAGRVEPQVKVVRLRKREMRTRTEGDGDAIEWSHRWIVRGFWRNQWYPSLQEHRPRYIHEYIKGPEDKPLVVHDRVFVVDR